VPARLAIVPIVAAVLATACLGKTETQTPAPPRGADVGGPLADVNLRYRRPMEFMSPGRPDAFYVIVDYRGAATEERYPGSWDDRTQTLSATVTVPLIVENLVYVADAAVQPGLPTTITAARGALKEVTCPESVNPLYSCLLLQVLH